MIPQTSRYEKSARPNAIPIDDFTQTSLFFPKKSCTIKNGQINIIYKNNRYEYQLNSESFLKLNNIKVMVRWRDIKEGLIYIYDSQVDKGIITVKQKVKIHAVAANQTENDIKYFNKNAGRKKGIKSKMKKADEIIRDAAILDNACAFDTINKLTCSKFNLNKLERNANARESIRENYGINLDNINLLPKYNELSDNSLKPELEKQNRNPFHWKKEIAIRKLTECELITNGNMFDENTIPV